MWLRGDHCTHCPKLGVSRGYAIKRGPLYTLSKVLCNHLFLSIPATRVKLYLPYVRTYVRICFNISNTILYILYPIIQLNLKHKSLSATSKSRAYDKILRWPDNKSGHYIFLTDILKNTRTIIVISIFIAFIINMQVYMYCIHTVYQYNMRSYM